jgi:hypothetical protein
LKKVNGNWKTLPQKLKVPRRFFAALILPKFPLNPTTTEPIETTTVEVSACGTCTEEGNFPNPNDPTNETYKSCIKLDDGSIVPTCLPCPFATFFDPVRKACFYECQVPDDSLDCNWQSTTCDADGTCMSSFQADPHDCHYFCFCYADVYTDFTLRYCRQSCPFHSSSNWMVFNKLAKICVVPLINGTCEI